MPIKSSVRQPLSVSVSACLSSRSLSLSLSLFRYRCDFCQVYTYILYVYIYSGYCDHYYNIAIDCIKNNNGNKNVYTPQNDPFESCGEQRHKDCPQNQLLMRAQQQDNPSGCEGPAPPPGFKQLLGSPSEREQRTSLLKDKAKQMQTFDTKGLLCRTYRYVRTGNTHAHKTM